MSTKGKTNHAVVVNESFENWVSLPDELYAEIDCPRYSSLGPGRMQDYSSLSVTGSDFSNNRRSFANGKKIVCILGFVSILSLTALSLAMLMVFGQINAGGKCSCKKELHQAASIVGPSSLSGSEIEDVSKLKRDFLEFQNKMLEQERELRTLKSNLTSTSRTSLLQRERFDNIKTKVDIQAGVLTDLQTSFEKINTKTEARINKLDTTVKGIQNFSRNLEHVVNGTKVVFHKQINGLEGKLHEMEQNISTTRLGAEKEIKLVADQVDEMRNISKRNFRRLSQADQILNHTMQQMSFTLNVKLTNVSKMPGPRGFPGPPGLRGPLGPPGQNGHNCTVPPNQSQPTIHTGAALSGCKLKLKNSTRGTSGDSFDMNVFAKETKDTQILGATCTSDGAREYQFRSFKDSVSNFQMYECQCKGKAVKFTPTTGTVCQIYYWECPRT